ncbi:hypothetical protein [Sphingomonas endophytica]|uniref:hypothetical protein n=1 Tax=Sphingomonas endophytica TaxID=869719 RepID=UPI00187C2D6C|nr:hypothetical protein [Sphingomonas endophytica]
MRDDDAVLAARKRESSPMFRFIKSSFARQFAGGFLLGALGMVALHAAQPEMPANPYAPSHQVR